MENKTVGHVSTVSNERSSSFNVVSMGNKESYAANGRADDGEDESIVSSLIAEHAVLNGIGRMKKVVSVKLQVALRDCNEAQTFTVHTSGEHPAWFLKLSAESLALLNVVFFVTDAEFSAENLFIGLPVLRQLGVGTKTLRENFRDLLGRAECPCVKNGSPPDKIGRVRRLMIVRLDGVSNDAIMAPVNLEN